MGLLPAGRRPDGVGARNDKIKDFFACNREWYLVRLCQWFESS